MSKKSAIKNLMKAAPSGGVDLAKQIMDLQHRPDYEIVIRGTALVENSLVSCIKSLMINIDESEHNLLFSNGGRAPLSSLSSKIALCYAAGMFGSNTRSDLSIIRDVRNAFAHASQKLELENPSIKDVLSKLVIPNKIGGVPFVGINEPKFRFILSSSIISIYLDNAAAEVKRENYKWLAWQKSVWGLCD